MIFLVMDAKYDKHPMKKEYFRNKWLAECKTEEFKSSQMWQPKEIYMRSRMHTLKTNANPFEAQSKRRKHKLMKTESRQLENTGSEKLIDSNRIKLREREHEYIKEFEKRCTQRKVERPLMNHDLKRSVER